MEKIRISPLQFFSLVLLFELGTALVVNLGLEAKKDEWLAILIGLAIGLMLYAVYTRLYLWYPNMLPTAFFRILLGRYLGTLLGIAYMVFFLNKASRDLMDGGLLVGSFMLRETPLFIINLLMIITVAYTLHKGLEVLARTALIFMVIVIAIGILSLLLMGFAKIIDLNRLMPVMGNGIMPLLQAVPQKNYQFPFAEVIAFSMLLPFLNNPKKGVKAGYFALIFAGVILSLTVATIISVLGVELAERSMFPLLATIGKATISDFIQRPDIFVVMTLIVGVYFKMSIFSYAAVIGISDVFNIPYRKLIFPVALIILYTTTLLARSTSEYLVEGGKMLYLVDPLFYIVLPVIVLVAAIIHKLVSRSGGPGAGGGGTIGAGAGLGTDSVAMGTGAGAGSDRGSGAAGGASTGVKAGSGIGCEVTGVGAGAGDGGSS
ncbi:GerAB/ArcD/ProY family transporter [Paenibacillus lentus]|uniref:Spore gernimation protein n=1 Tax=Paenibacillus lentus TaxID=1338368 RepID=A0A3S8RS53_9BACL|nr:GerAB/ArcD/ProY family transporter [Paenibacillus lentus]AZK45826.1 spore gernimation protein [Paenibacillus lentus]